MKRKERCKELMLKFFGTASAKSVDSMDEDKCVAICRAKVAGFIGEMQAREFDAIK